MFNKIGSIILSWMMLFSSAEAHRGHWYTGSVHVKGYTKKNGTHVKSYTRYRNGYESKYAH